MNDNNLDHEPPIPSKILRPSGRLSHLNQNLPSEYQDHQLPGVGNLRDPLLERRIKRDHAATKIQAAYRSYTVRKSLHWSNEKQHRLNSDFNKRVCSSSDSFLDKVLLLNSPFVNRQKSLPMQQIYHQQSLIFASLMIILLLVQHFYVIINEMELI
jgi:hypothetical protein